MLKSPILKSVANPPLFAYMPPLLAAISLVGGMLLWFLGAAAGFGAIPGILWGIIGSMISAYLGVREPHLHDILMARQNFLTRRPSLVRSQGHRYVG